MIRLESVTKRYGDKIAVDRLSFEVEAGEVCVLIGPSGCGKTTTLRMINRLIEPTSGRILVDGRDNRSMRPEELRRGLGYAIQSVGLFPHLNVEGNIGVVPRLLGWEPARIHERARELLALVGLDADEYLSKYPAQLSGGEAQRVGVARALAADPPVLLMDEPFGAVDPLNRVRLQSEFARIQRELHKTVVLVTHDIDEAIRLADRVAIMREGRLMQYDTPEEVLENPANKFVHDFVGADRALKRLVRMPVASAMERHVAKVQVTDLAAAERKAADVERFVYLVDADGRLVGWVDTEDLAREEQIEDAVTHVDPGEAAVREDATLKEALSIMLGQGFRSVPVVDEGCRLVGVVDFSTIEDAMGESPSRAGSASSGSPPADATSASRRGGEGT
ncbi:MAG: ABC transporter ATP-binding protein [Coriobacteriia bacterium]